MSEILKPNQENFQAQIPEPMQLAVPAEAEQSRFTGDAGAINVGEMAARTGEVIGQGIDYAKVAYQGLRVAISEKRRDFAGRRMEKMEHKNALYDDLGALAQTGERTRTPTSHENEYDPFNDEPLGTGPRSIVERIVDSRTESKRKKKSEADLDTYQISKIYGTKDSSPGRTDFERFVDKRELGREVRKGNITAREAAVEKIKIDAQPIARGSRLRRHAKSEEVIRGTLLDIATKQPISKRYRTGRRNEAVRDIKRHHHRAEKHRQKANDLFYKRNQPR